MLYISCVFKYENFYESLQYRIMCNAKNRTHVHSLSLLFARHCRKVNERNGF